MSNCVVLFTMASDCLGVFTSESELVASRYLYNALKNEATKTM